MSEHFDRNETRPPKSREVAMFRDFKAIISIAKSTAPALRKLVRGVDFASIKRREDLARLPVTRDTQFAQAISEDPPYGGALAARPGQMRHLLLNTAAGGGRDWWNAARAMYAAGFAKNDIILNCASYHMSFGGHLVDGGASALGCAVIPVGSKNVERHLDAIRQLKPNAFCGKASILQRIFESAAASNTDVSTIRKALVFGAPLSTSFRREALARGVHIQQAYVTAAAGIVAYETGLPDGSVNEGMIVNEGVVVEIVKPGTDIPAAPGEVGEIVITRLNVDFPLVRFGTGDLSRIIPGSSPCGRTNFRIQGWMGRVDETTRFHEWIVLPSQVMDMRARHACVHNMRLVLTGDELHDESILRVEGPSDDPQLPINLRGTMRDVLGFEARIEIVAPGVLPDDGRLIVDERVRK